MKQPAVGTVVDTVFVEDDSLVEDVLGEEVLGMADEVAPELEGTGVTVFVSDVFGLLDEEEVSAFVIGVPEELEQTSPSTSLPATQPLYFLGAPNVFFK